MKNNTHNLQEFAISDEQAHDVKGGLLVQFTGKGVQLDWNQTGSLQFGIGDAIRFSIQDIRNFRNVLNSTGLFGSNSIIKNLFSIFRK